MPFGLKNTGVTYLRAMNAIFNSLIGKTIEVYIDDNVIKLREDLDHTTHLKNAFSKMRADKLKLNLLKCAFRVRAGQFLGFLVHQKGIKIELQAFLGRINYLRYFIGNVVEKTQVFYVLLETKKSSEFTWTKEHKDAFNKLKNCLM